MKMPSRSLSAMLIAVSAALATAACGDDEPAAGSGTSSSVGPASGVANSSPGDSHPTGSQGTIPEGTRLRIGDRQQTIELSLQLSGNADFDYDVEYANFQGGPAILEAFNAGAIDVAVTGDVPPLTVLARDQPISVVAAARSTGNQLAIVVPPGSDVDDVGDLAGRSVAYHPGTAAQSFFRAAAAEAGIEESDVTAAQLDYQSAIAALASGDLDAAVVAEPQLSIYLAQQPDARVVRDASGLSTGLSFVLASDAALEDEATAAAIADFVDRWHRSLEWRNANREDYVSGLYVGAYGLPDAVGRAIYDKLGTDEPVELGGNVVSALQALADDFTAAGVFPEPLDVTTLFHDLAGS